jgi:hypothetical protein
MHRVALLSLLALTACFSSGSSRQEAGPGSGDGGFDATLGDDAGGDATADAAPDASYEAGSGEASADAGTTVDATSPVEEPGPDAAPIGDATVGDAAPPVDAGGTDTGEPFPDAAPILLGPTSNRAAFALGPDGIYFTLLNQTALYRAPYGAGQAIVLVANAVSAGGGSGPFAVDATNVYWQDVANNGLYSLPFGSSVGATPTTISTDSQVAQGLHMVAYQGQLFIAISGGGLERVSIVPPSSPATNGPIAMSGSASCGTLGCDPTLAVTPQGVFWTVSYPASMGGGIYGCALDAAAGYSSNGTLVVSTDYVNAVTSDSNNLYWVTSGPSGTNGSAVMAPLTDAGAAVTIASGIGNTQGIAVDTSTNPPGVFWTNRGGTGSVLGALAVAGSQVVTLATGQGMPFDIGANAQAVVWSQIYTTNGGVQELVR